MDQDERRVELIRMLLDEDPDYACIGIPQDVRGAERDANPDGAHPQMPLLRSPCRDDRFVEDDGWHRASDGYRDFLRHADRRILFL